MNRQCSIHVFDGSFLVPGALTRVRRMSALTAAVTLGAFGTPEARCGDGPHFVDEAFVRGIDYVVTQGDWNEQFGCGVGLIDLDDDGDPDLVVTGREDGVVGVYENDGTGHFIDRSTTSGILPMDMPSGVVAGDYDRDGDRDIYITNYKTADVMLRNDGGFTFTDVTVEAGLGHTGAGCGASFNDYNGDGWIDLFVAARTSVVVAPEHDALYRNNGDGTFTDVAPRLGVDSDFPTFQPIFFDHDLDGDRDLYLSTDKGS
ncbi:MAG: FG-GAP repeat domain-containing protein, partial [Planctomycetota bacterium]